jgi:anti-anti-sigma factor
VISLSSIIGLSLARGLRYFAAIVSFDSEHAVLVVSGDEDRLTCGRRRRALSTALKAGGDVVVDLRELRFADSSLMVDLAVLARRLRLQGRRLRLRGAQPQIRTLIELMGLHRLPAVAFEAA